MLSQVQTPPKEDCSHNVSSPTFTISEALLEHILLKCQCEMGMVEGKFKREGIYIDIHFCTEDTNITL